MVVSVRRHLLTGFMAGELDPHLDGRVDTDQYAFGLSRCENFVAINEGPLVKRQGFEFIREADPTASWLTAFRRSIEQEYVLEWGEQKLRFFTNGGRLEPSPGTAYEVPTPYAAIEAPQVSRQQSFDRLYCDHQSHPPSALRRDTPSTFAFETIANLDGPFLDPNTDETKAVSCSGTLTVGGTVTLTGNAGFAPGHVGAPFRIEARDFANVTRWEPGMKDIAVGDKVRTGVGRVYVAQTAGTTGQYEPEHSEGSYYDGQLEKDLLNDKGPYGVKWSYLHDHFGIATITAVSGPASATGTVTRRLPDSLGTVASYRWAHSAFSAAEGWPHLVTIYKGRQIHFKDTEIIGSVAGDYGGGRVNYAAYAESGRIEADLAFRRTIGLEDPPLWVSADRKLLIGTAARELAIGPFNAGAAFSGSNIEAEPQSFYGSERIYPVQTGTETIFVERGGRRCRAADYDFGRDRYDAPDLNATSRHITQGGVVQLAYQRIPHSLVHGVRADGQLIVHARSRGEIRGFTRFVLGGGARALSAVSVVGADNRTDDLWILVARENGAGETVKEIWKQSAWRELGTDQREAFYVDGGVRIAATGGDGSFTGLGHLAGQDVAVLVDGVVMTGLSVDGGGSLQLPSEAIPGQDYTVIVGLAYTAIATTMRPELRDGKGSSAGLRQRVLKTLPRLLESLGVKVSAPGGALEELVLRRGGQAQDTQIPLYSGDPENGLVDAEFDRDGRASWISDVPLPATITLAVSNIDVSTADA